MQNIKQLQKLKTALLHEKSRQSFTFTGIIMALEFKQKSEYFKGWPTDGKHWNEKERN